MPLYEYKCASCGDERTLLRCIAFRDDIVMCHVCSFHDETICMQRILSPTPGVVKNPAVPKGTK